MSGPSLLTEALSCQAMRAIWSDGSFIAACLEVERVWTAAAVAEGSAPSGVLGEMDGLIAALRREWPSLRSELENAGRPVAPLVSWICRHASTDLGRVLHLGLTTQDVIDAAVAMLARSAGERMSTRGAAAADELTNLARVHRTTPMLGRTNGQGASVITFGLLVAGWRTEIDRALARIAERSAAMQQVQLAGAVGLSAPFGNRTEAVRAAAAGSLGLTLSARGEAPSRDRGADLALSLAMLCQTLGRIGVTTAAMMADGVGELSEGGAGGESSAMPHKRNPRLPERLQAISTRARARTPEALAAMETLHLRSGETWMLEWSALPELFDLAGAGLNTLAALLERLEVHPERMAAALDAAGADAVSDRLLIRRSAIHGRLRAKQMPPETGTDETLTSDALAASALAVDALLGD